MQWSVGLSGIVGAEWFVRRDISLTAGYRSDLLYGRDSSKYEVDGEKRRASTQNEFGLDARGVRLGLFVYF